MSSFLFLLCLSCLNPSGLYAQVGGCCAVSDASGGSGGWVSAFEQSDGSWVSYNDGEDIVLCDNGDGSMSLTGTIEDGNECGSNDGWTIDLTLFDERSWNRWREGYLIQDNDSSDDDDCDGRSDDSDDNRDQEEHEDFDYYNVVGRLIGTGCNAGDTIVFKRSKEPYRFQIGRGASFRNHCAFGLSAWLVYDDENGTERVVDFELTMDGGCYNVIDPEDPAGTPIPIDFSYECTDSKKVDLYGSGSNCEYNSYIDIPNPENVFQVVVEIVYKGGSVGDRIAVVADGQPYFINKVPISGNSSSIHVYRGQITGSVSEVAFTSIPFRCKLQSMIVYTFREDVSSGGQRGQFTAFSGYHTTRTLNFTIDPDTDPRDITISVPISEMTLDCRILNISATAGAVSNTVTTFAPGPAYGCCLDVPVVVLEDVPGNVTNIELAVESPRGSRWGCPVGPDQNGQSFVLAGLVLVDKECVECTTPIVQDDDFELCPNGTLNLSLIHISEPTRPY